MISVTVLMYNKRYRFEANVVGKFDQEQVIALSDTVSQLGVGAVSTDEEIGQIVEFEGYIFWDPKQEYLYVMEENDTVLNSDKVDIDWDIRVGDIIGKHVRA